MKDVLIIGAGLFGSVAARACVEQGHRITLFDDHRPLSGSRPAACLIRPSWIAGLGSKGTKGLAALRQWYTVRTIPFRTPVGTVDIQWIPPSEILCHAVQAATVEKIGDGWLQTDTGERHEGVLLIAAGIWSKEFIFADRLHPISSIRALTGAALRYAGETPARITPWAPFKQCVSFVRNPGETWFGDGTAILRENWTEQRVQQSVSRAAARHQLCGTPFAVEIGCRPYVPGHAGYFTRLGENVWVSTGGAKNGTVLAASQACEFVRALS